MTRSIVVSAALTPDNHCIWVRHGASQKRLRGLQNSRNAATIQGVGLLTVLTVLAETNGFVLARSIKQVVSYAGLGIVEHQSGQSRAPTHISKRGNARLRRALFVPANDRNPL